MSIQICIAMGALQRMASSPRSMAAAVPSVKEMKIGQLSGLTFAQIMTAKKRRAGFLEPQDETKTALKVRFPAPVDAPDDDGPEAEPIDLAAKPKHRIRFPATIVERRPDGLLRRRKADR